MLNTSSPNGVWLRIAILGGVLLVAATVARAADDPLRRFVANPFPDGAGAHRTQLQADGGSKETERAVILTLDWLARHQDADGGWSLQKFARHCTDKTCTGAAGEESRSAATALSTLPFLAIGQTASARGPYQPLVKSAIAWLAKHQAPDGDLSAGAAQQMYSHALATIVLCNAFAMARDKPLGDAARQGLDFIERSQDSRTGGWNNRPHTSGGTTIVGWNMLALKSGQLAGLKVKPATLDNVKKYLATVAVPQPDGRPSGRYFYWPGAHATPTMTAIGLVCNQDLGLAHSDPLIAGGVNDLLRNLPEHDVRDVHYWFFATQAMHRMNDSDWTRWSHQMRKVLVLSQMREGCCAGSWDPNKPVRDVNAALGGRLTMTSLACLTLEVYYRYLPIFQAGKPPAAEKK